MATPSALRERLRLSLWFIPALFALGAAVLALAIVAIDQALTASLPFAFGGTAEGARSVLATIAQSMLTFTGLVFTITMLVLQLASSQLSPRVMRTFLRDRGNQTVLGMFVATFVFTLLVLRAVRSETDGSDAFVPGIGVWIAFALLLTSVGAFIWYIDHMAHAIRAGTVIAQIWAETAATIDRLYPADGPLPDHDVAAAHGGPPDLVLKATAPGVVIAIDEDRLRSVVDADGRSVVVLPAVGEFVPEGGPLAHLYGSWDGQAAGEVRRSVGFGDERTMEQDVGFGFRQLVDIAARALSPGTNDPTTAVQALDRIHDLLRRLARRRFPPRTLVNRGHAVLLERPTFETFVSLGLDEIRLAGAGQLQVVRRMREILDDLETVVPDGRAAILHRQRAALDALGR